MASILKSLLPATVPVTYFTLSVGAFVIKPYARMMSMPLLLLLAYLSFTSAGHCPSPLDNLWGLTVCIWVAHSTSMEWLEDPSIWGPKACRNKQDAPVHRAPDGQIHMRLRFWNNTRLLGTPRQVHRVHQQVDPPGSARFTVLRLGKLVGYWIVHTSVVPHLFPGLFIPLDVDEFGPAREVFLRRLLFPPPAADPVTLRESLLRGGYVAWWLICTTTCLDAAHTALSLVAVSLVRFDAPADWPPIFGPLSDAWSLRRFWGKFWHQVVVRPYTNYGVFVSRRLLGLRSGSAPDKILVVFCVFFLSGLTHAAVARNLGDCCGWARDLWWFCANFVAGALEMFVVRLLGALAARWGQRERWARLCHGWWGKTVGYVWVFLFLCWSIPKWQYPKLYCRLQDTLAQMEAGGLR